MGFEWVGEGCGGHHGRDGRRTEAGESVVGSGKATGVKAGKDEFGRVTGGLRA
jgi:hypothetical protein